MFIFYFDKCSCWFVQMRLKFSVLLHQLFNVETTSLHNHTHLHLLFRTWYFNKDNIHYLIFSSFSIWFLQSAYLWWNQSSNFPQSFSLKSFTKHYSLKSAELSLLLLFLLMYIFVKLLLVLILVSRWKRPALFTGINSPNNAMNQVYFEA